MVVLRDNSIGNWERERLETVQSILKQAGFTVSQPCYSRPSCFDFAARKGRDLMFMRCQRDIGSLSSSDSRELRAISESFSAAPLLIGRETREKPLEDDTIYTRYEVLAVTPKTLENVVLHNAAPLIQASPGGYYVEIDGEALKRKRQELGLSVGEMAEMIGISRRTVYGYERGMAKASVTAAYNLIWVLGIPVARPVNLLEKSATQRKRCILTSARRAFARNKLLSKLFNKFARYHITTVRKAPFDFIISVPEEKMRIVGGVADEREPALNRRVEEILSVSGVVQAHPILITEGRSPSEQNILRISSEEISRIENPEELISDIKKASSDVNPFRP